MALANAAGKPHPTTSLNRYWMRLFATAGCANIELRHPARPGRPEAMDLDPTDYDHSMQAIAAGAVADPVRSRGP